MSIWEWKTNRKSIAIRIPKRTIEKRRSVPLHQTMEQQKPKGWRTNKEQSKGPVGRLSRPSANPLASRSKSHSWPLGTPITSTLVLAITRTMCTQGIH